MNLHFQNLKDLTMDQIFFCSQKRNHLFSSFAKTRISKGRKKKTKYFHSVARNFYNAIPLQLPRNFFHGHKGLVSLVIHCTEYNFTEAWCFSISFRLLRVHIKIEFLRFDSSPTRQEAQIIETGVSQWRAWKI